MIQFFCDELIQSSVFSAFCTVEDILGRLFSVHNFVTLNVSFKILNLDKVENYSDKRSFKLFVMMLVS